MNMQLQHISKKVATHLLMVVIIVALLLLLAHPHMTSVTVYGFSHFLLMIEIFMYILACTEGVLLF